MENETFKYKLVTISASKKGIPVSWECGGGATNSGSATLWGNPDGSKKQAWIVRTRGMLSNGEHALVPVNEGDLHLHTTWWHGVIEHKLCRVNKIIKGDDKVVAELKVIATYENGEWDNEPSPVIEQMCQAGARKAKTYHCRSAVWVEPPKPRY